MAVGAPFPFSCLVFSSLLSCECISRPFTMKFIPAFLRPGSNVRASNIEDGLSAQTLQMPSGPTDNSVHNIQLATYRHMVGIYNTKELASTYGKQKGTQTPDVSHNNLHFDGRAAPNLGIYNRVCHREAKAKLGFKFASILINSCLGIQIIVAAALTAMGASNTNHPTITFFGAVNTCIAGILTYLKGSGLPNRIRWYENEWKKVREYIEQRERDFARPDCRLDVNQIVKVVEAMYDEVKADIHNNTPEMYISVSEIRARSATADKNPHMPTLDTLVKKAEDQVKSGLQEVEDKYGHRITEFLEKLAAKEEERLKQLGVEVEQGKLAALEKSLELREKETELYERGLESTKSEMQRKDGNPAGDGDSARAGASQSEVDMEKTVSDLTDVIVQTGHERREQSGRAVGDVQVATDRVQSTDDSAQRTVKTYDNEPGTRK
jgi:hypothetical protein